MAVQNYEVFRAGGSKGPNARGNGQGGLLARGFYYRRADETLIGPFDTGMQAELVMYIAENSRRCHESELSAAEQAALRALRRKGVVSPHGLHIANAYRAGMFLRRAELAQGGA